MRITATRILFAFVCSTGLLTGCGSTDAPNAPPPFVADISPAQFNFVDQTGVPTSSVVTSAAVTITGINSPTNVTVAGGSYSIGCSATYITNGSPINNNQTVCARHTSAAVASTVTNTILTVGDKTDTFTSTTAGPAVDTSPDQFNLVDQAGVTVSTVITSAAVTITGIDSPTLVTVSGVGGSYSIGCTATFVTSANPINNNQTVCVRHTSAATASTATNTILTVGDKLDTFTSTTAGPIADTSPVQFNFVDQTGVPVSTVITSAAVTITGIDSPTNVSVAGPGGSYSIGCTATFVSTGSSINNNQTVCVRHTSSAAASTITSTVLTVGDKSDTFTSTTAGPVLDTSPVQFNFVDQTGVTVSSVITSAAVTITGIDSPTNVSVAGPGGSYSIGCTATFVSSINPINNNQTVCVRHTSAAAAGTATNTILTVGDKSDTFTSTTASSGPVSSLLPFLKGTGDLQLFNPAAALSATNPLTVDTGLAPTAAGSVCNECFDQAELFSTGSVSGTAVSNLHTARLAYIKRAPGNDSGGAVFKLDITQGAASNQPVPISSLTDGCNIVKAETADFANIDNSAVVIERAGPDHLCSVSADNVVTIIRLNTPAANAGLNIPLVLDPNFPIRNSILAQTNALGAITGYVSLEGGVNPLLVHRDVNLANPVTLLTLAGTLGSAIERSDPTHLFVTASPLGEGLQLFRVEGNGTLSPSLYSFGFNAANPIQDALRDATNLYFSDANLLVRIPVDSTTANAAVITTLDPTLRIGNRALDTSTTPGRVVFEAQDNTLSIAGGVFSAATTANNAVATVLAHNPPPDAQGGFAFLMLTSNGRAYINIANHATPTNPEEALRINTDGTGPVNLTDAYWAGSNRATAFDFAVNFSVPTQTIFLVTRVFAGGGLGTETLKVVDPVTGVTGITLGSVDNAAEFISMNVAGLGRFALARAEIDRSGTLDNDVYVLDPTTAASLAPLAQTTANDIPLDGQQRPTGNVCLPCL